MGAIRSWVSDHKLSSIGALWASAIGGSLAYSSSRRSTLKPSLRLIHARMHAQAITLAVLSGAAVYHYYQKQARQPDVQRDTINKEELCGSYTQSGF